MTEFSKATIRPTGWLPRSGPATSAAHTTVARALKAGTVRVNCYGSIDPISPLGGYKQSGFSRELGKHSLELYTQIKSVYVKL
jgi:acyl-CoA reductase-like NAD-dependent aldehyde dehydrogenase